MKMFKTRLRPFFLPALFPAFLFCGLNTSAQDPRLSLYNSMPLLVNPALTGNIKVPLRLSVVGSQVSTGQLSNRIGNVGVDAAIGKKGGLGVGINYMQSGSPQFAMSGSYVGFSLSKRFYLDQQKIHQLRFGGQVSLLKGRIDLTKGGYDKFLDVRAFRYWIDSNARSSLKGSGQYLNYSIGAYYRYEIPRLTLETGISAYNITNPLAQNIFPGSPVRKRYRATSMVSFTFNFNPANSFRFETFSWYEGLYLREYIPKRDDSTHIHENTYSLTWYRMKSKHPYSLGLYSRSLKAVYGVAAVELSPSVKLAFSYEVPFFAPYYGVRHLEMGATFFPLKSKKSKAVPVPAADPFAPKVEDCPCAGSKQPVSVLRPADSTSGTVHRIDTVYTAKQNTDTVFRVVHTRDTVYLPALARDTVRVRVPVSQPVMAPKKDTDKDGVPDDVDKCPNARGTIANEGCPADVEIPKGAQATYIIYFDYDRSVLKPASVAELNLVRAALEKHPSARLVLTGHTDLDGSDDYNLRLSKRRVTAAADYLKQKGVPAESISTSFLGMRRPKFNDKTQHHAAINRRVEISLVY